MKKKSSLISTRASTTPVNDALHLLQSLQKDGENKILVGFSGGKDSICVLDLCCTVFGQSNVQPYFLYWIRDLECEQITISRVLARYPEMPGLIQLPHYGLVEYLRNSYGRKFSPEMQLRFASKSAYRMIDTERIARYRSGIHWIASGHRIMDSLHRRGMLNQCQGIWKENTKGEPVRRIYPIFKWTPQHVFSYLKTRKLPIPDMMGKNYINTSGVALHDPVWIASIKKNWPRDYQKIKQLFPLIDQDRFRDEVRAKYSIRNQSNLETSYGDNYKKE